jgi:outer membrane lipoprotein-sorting protein
VNTLTRLGKLARGAACLILLPIALAGGSPPPQNTGALIQGLREKARRINGFEARLTVRAGGTSQSGTLLFLAPDKVHMEMKVAGLGEQQIMSDGKILWTVTPQARLATKIDLQAVRRSWHRPLPNQALAIRDVFEIIKPGTVRSVKEEALRGVKTRLFEGTPETGLDLRRNAALPDRVRAWVGEDGLLRRQVLMKGDEVLMDATFQIMDTNPHIRPGLFTFEPPSDYQVQDLTDSTLQTLRSLASG